MLFTLFGVMALVVSAFTPRTLASAGIAFVVIGAFCFACLLLHRRDVRSGAIKD